MCVWVLIVFSCRYWLCFVRVSWIVRWQSVENELELPLMYIVFVPYFYKRDTMIISKYLFVAKLFNTPQYFLLFDLLHISTRDSRACDRDSPEWEIFHSEDHDLICSQIYPTEYFSRIHRDELTHNTHENRIRDVFGMPSLWRSVVHCTVNIYNSHNDPWALQYRDTPLSLYGLLRLRPLSILVHRRYRDSQANFHHCADSHILLLLIGSRGIRFLRFHSRGRRPSHTEFHPYNTR